MGSPYGTLTRSYACCCMPIFVFLPPCGVRLDGGQDAMTHRRRGFVLPVLPFNPVIFSAVPTSETQRASPAESTGLLSVRTGRIRYTVVWPHDGYRGLCLVLQTRPGRTPPQICLPSTLSDTEHTCTSTHAFASGFLQPLHCCNDLAFSYPSPPSGWIWTLPGNCVRIPGITI